MNGPSAVISMIRVFEVETILRDLCFDLETLVVEESGQLGHRLRVCAVALTVAGFEMLTIPAASADNGVPDAEHGCLAT